jgi:tape measure domain-containing protein
MPAATETFEIDVKLDEADAVRSLDKIEKGMKKVESAAKKIEGALKAAALFLAVEYGLEVAKSIVKIADEYTTLINVLRIVTGTTENAEAAFGKLLAIANRTRTPIEAAAKLFQRVSLAGRDLGASQKEIYTFVEAVGSALAAQGTGADEAKGALNQLSQALSSGQVQAEEFNQIIEGGYPIALAAAKGIDEAAGSVGRLRAMVKAGKITSEELFRAILSQSKALEEQMAKANPTIVGAFTVLRNQTVKLLGDFNKANGAARGFAGALFFLADHLEEIARTVAALSIALGVHFAKKAVVEAVKAIKTLSIAIAANPLGALLTVITLVISFLVAFGDTIKVSENRLATLADVASATWEKISAGLSTVGAWFSKVFGGIAEWARGAFGEVELSVEGFLRFGAKAVDAYIGFYVGLWRAIVAIWNGLSDAIMEVEIGMRNGLIKGWNLIVEGVAWLADHIVRFFRGAFGAIGEIFGALPAILKQIFVEAMVGALDVVQANLGALTDLLNALPGVDLEPPKLDLLGLREAAEKDIPSIGALAAKGFNEAFGDEALITGDALKIDLIENEYAGAGSRLGTAIADGFLSGFDVSVAEDFLDDVLERAEEIAKARKKVVDETPIPVGQKPPPEAKDGEKSPSFAELLAAYEQESGLLRLLAHDREVASEQLRFEDEMKKKLNETQRETLEQAVRERQLLQERADIMDSLDGQQQRDELRRRALNELLAESNITLAEHTRLMSELELAVLRATEAENNMTAGFTQQLRIMVLETRNASADMGASLGEVFGPGGSLTDGIADATARAIVFGESFKEGMKQVAKEALATVISSLVKVGLTMALNAALGKALQSSASASTAAAAGAAASAWAPAAALASLATLGANAAPATAAVASTTAVAAGVAATSGFARGGYTGDGGTGDVAGVVHGKEFVVGAAATRRNRGFLESLNRGGSAGGGGVTVNVVNQASGLVEVTARQVSRSEVEIIARAVVAEEAPRAVAQDLSRPGSAVGSALARHTTSAPRRR